KRKLDELKKLLDQKTPLTPEQIEELKRELQRLSDQNEQLRASNQQLNDDLEKKKNELAQAQSELQALQQELTFWRDHNVVMSIASMWDSDTTDIDVMVRAPSGEIFAPKTEKLFGRQTSAYAEDSHGKFTNGSTFRQLNEGMAFPLLENGDYLVFYRVPANATPADYSHLVAGY